MPTSHYCNGKWRDGPVSACPRHKKLSKKQTNVYRGVGEPGGKSGTKAPETGGKAPETGGKAPETGGKSPKTGGAAVSDSSTPKPAAGSGSKES